jgi:hypothetical protein
MAPLILMHVTDGIEMNQGPDASDNQTHYRRQVVKSQGEVNG